MIDWVVVWDQLGLVGIGWRGCVSLMLKASNHAQGDYYLEYAGCCVPVFSLFKERLLIVRFTAYSKPRTADPVENQASRYQMRK